MTGVLQADKFEMHDLHESNSFVLRHDILILRNCVGQCLVPDGEVISARTWWVCVFPPQVMLIHSYCCADVTLQCTI